MGQIYGVDVVVAGGGNELLANEDDLLVPRAKEPDGPYPIMATDFEGTRVPLAPLLPPLCTAPGPMWATPQAFWGLRFLAACSRCTWMLGE